jgi:hypothetical protein
LSVLNLLMAGFSSAASDLSAGDRLGGLVLADRVSSPLYLRSNLDLLGWITLTGSEAGKDPIKPSSNSQLSRWSAAL